MLKQKITGLLACTSLLAGCATMPTPRNLPEAQYQREQQVEASLPESCSLPGEPALLAGLDRKSVV